MKDYGDQLSRSITCSDAHKIQEYQCKIAGYKKGNDKICVYVIVIYANYESNHIAHFIYYISRYKANLKLNKKRIWDKIVKKRKEKQAIKLEEKKVKEKKAWSLIQA